VIETELRAARCAIVLWSADSVRSDWVRAEAEEAAARGILAPALLGGCEPPLRFRRLQAADLAGWQGEEGHEGLGHLLDAIREIAGPPSIPSRDLSSAEKPRPADPSDLSAPGVVLEAGETVLLRYPAVKRRMLWAHLECHLVVTDRRLMFIDQTDPKYSFTLSREILKDARLSKGMNEDLVIVLAGGVRYDVGLDIPGAWREVAQAVEQHLN
jgi:hypothetical protein